MCESVFIVLPSSSCHTGFARSVGEISEHNPPKGRPELTPSNFVNPQQRPSAQETSDGRIRCVAFDAVGTLIFAEPSVAEAYASIGQRFGSQFSTTDVGARFRDAFQRLDAEAGRWNGEDGATNEEHERIFWRRVVDEVLPDVTDRAACFDELFEHFARPESWRCFDDAGSTLSELSRRGYRIAIASNFDARLNRVCDGLPELREVPWRFISSLVGFRKTHPGFFAKLIEQAQCSANEILMVGDDLQQDVRSAQRTGLNAIHLVRGVSSPSEVGAINLLSDLLELLP